MDDWPDLKFDDWLDPPNYDPALWTPCKWWRSTMTAITRNVDLAPEKLAKLRKKRWWQLQMELRNCDQDFLDITIKQTKAIEENIKWINSKKQELAIHKLCSALELSDETEKFLKGQDGWHYLYVNQHHFKAFSDEAQNIPGLTEDQSLRMYHNVVWIQSNLTHNPILPSLVHHSMILIINLNLHRNGGTYFIPEAGPIKRGLRFLIPFNIRDSDIIALQRNGIRDYNGLIAARGTHWRYWRFPQNRRVFFNVHPRLTRMLWHFSEYIDTREDGNPENASPLRYVTYLTQTKNRDPKFESAELRNNALFNIGVKDIFEHQRTLKDTRETQDI